ncbi:MAG: Uncharacterised protein [Bacteroidota bacterium]|nr:MAG: Uncharacterised protein [Bacteroidota bacterium]
MLPNHKLYKKLFAFGLVLLLASYTLILILELEFKDYFQNLNTLLSDEVIIFTVFSIGFVLICFGLIFRVFTKG